MQSYRVYIIIVKIINQIICQRFYSLNFNIHISLIKRNVGNNNRHSTLPRCPVLGTLKDVNREPFQLLPVCCS